MRDADQTDRDRDGRTPAIKKAKLQQVVAFHLDSSLRNLAPTHYTCRQKPTEREEEESCYELSRNLGNVLMVDHCRTGSQSLD